MIVFIVIAVCLLVTISFIHVYWAFGGRWGIAAAIPSESGERAFTPSPVITLFVGLLLSMAAILLLLQVDIIPLFVPQIIVQIGCWICMFVFTVRVIGEFNYFGIFKRKKGTYFAKMDTMLFIPLCAFLAVSFLIAVIGME
ncbi:membrane protein [Bacillus manliponensis]|uniref:Membrane protein n=1 Tax=Bacillus manliponensis TaxID=574376 RepID=A0A073JV83_9BACI|nr:DUF3995 domain-containing protein [Bacillus manliponensis]KEK18220.1 membrane protein [Bacillus manliponensis]